jgi:hypothetical protein
LLKLIDELDLATPGRSVAILIPELVTGHCWKTLFHSRRAGRLRAALLAHGDPRLVV